MLGIYRFSKESFCLAVPPVSGEKEVYITEDLESLKDSPLKLCLIERYNRDYEDEEKVVQDHEFSIPVEMFFSENCDSKSLNYSTLLSECKNA